MADMDAALLAQPIPQLLPLCDTREPLRVLVASLALGGAERIVLEWLGAEAALGRAVELAVLHPRRIAWPLPAGIDLHHRAGEPPQAFLAALAARWRTARAPVSVHLVADEWLQVLWDGGVRTVPVVHNMREGWRSDPARWRAPQVPGAVACAAAVRDEMLARGCTVPVLVLRHRPALGATAFDPDARARLRAELGIGPRTLLVAAVGAFKPQKDYSRAIEVMRHLRRRREAVLLILGGVLDRAGLAELDGVMARACAAGLADHLRLPGFVQPIEPYYAAADALLNVSRFEGLSMAVQEALAAGLPAFATDVGGQREIRHANLCLLPAAATAAQFARRLADLPVRDRLAGAAPARAPRLWSLATAWQPPGERRAETLFVTANLNAGGAQRSLVNLVTRIAPRHPLAVAVCGETSHAAFPAALAASGIECFRPAAPPDPFALAESLLAWSGRHGARTLCFWNADPKLKLLLARTAPAGLRLVDVSPGHYAFEELEGAADFGAAIDLDAAGYYARLDALVLKHGASEGPACRRRLVIPNGVAVRETAPRLPGVPRFLVSGRIAPSKRLETVLSAFACVQRDHPAAELHLVGQAEPRHAAYLDLLQARAAGLRVRFHGARPGLEFLDEPFTAAVVLGTHQGSPNAVLEAMAAGIAVIANASGGTAAMLQDGESGWLLAEACTAAELAAAMAEAIGRPALTRARAAAGRKFVREHHRLDAMAARYLDLLAPERAAAGRTAVPPTARASAVRRKSLAAGRLPSASRR